MPVAATFHLSLGMSPRVCRCCLKSGYGFKKCAGCADTGRWYCGRRCQKLDWRAHRFLCFGNANIDRYTADDIGHSLQLCRVADWAVAEQDHWHMRKKVYFMDDAGPIPDATSRMFSRMRRSATISLFDMDEDARTWSHHISGPHGRTDSPTTPMDHDLRTWRELAQARSDARTRRHTPAAATEPDPEPAPTSEV